MLRYFSYKWIWLNLLSKQKRRCKVFCMHLFSTSMSVLNRLNNYYFRKCTLHIRVCLLLKEVLRRWHNCYRHIHTTFIKIYTKTLKGPTTILPSSTLYMFSECLHKRIPLNYELVLSSKEVRVHIRESPSLSSIHYSKIIPSLVSPTSLIKGILIHQLFFANNENDRVTP